MNFVSDRYWNHDHPSFAFPFCYLEHLYVVHKRESSLKKFIFREMALSVLLSSSEHFHVLNFISLDNGKKFRWRVVSSPRLKFSFMSIYNSHWFHFTATLISRAAFLLKYQYTIYCWIHSYFLFHWIRIGLWLWIGFE